MKLFSFFSNLRNRRQKRREAAERQHTLEQTALVFETLNKFKSAGLLYFDFKHHTVTIAQVLAEQFIYNDQEWQNFLRQCHLWAVYQWSVSEYTRIYVKVQADGEAAAYKEKQQPLTDAERHLARMQAVAAYDAEHADQRQLPVPDLQFMILGVLDGKPLAVARQLDGRYETAVVPDQPDEDE